MITSCQIHSPLKYSQHHGDPQGIRIIQKTNWSGVGVAFPRELLSEVIQEEHAKRLGVYMLIGDLAEKGTWGHPYVKILL